MILLINFSPTCFGLSPWSNSGSS